MTDTPNDLATQVGPSVEGLSYTEASRELDEIVHFFEQRDVDVDQLVGRLVRATALIEELDKRLRQTRMQVEQLVPRLAAVLSEGPSAAGTAGTAGTGGSRGAADLSPAAGASTGADTEVGEYDEDDEDDGHDIEVDDGTGDGDGGSTPGLF